MIHFLHSPKLQYHTDRSYLAQWFADDILIITDCDINLETRLQQMIQDHACQCVVVDITHNQMPWRDIPDFLKQFTVLSCEFTDWYQPRSHNVHYFPLWLWAFSARSQWLPETFGSSFCLDADRDKTLPMMCLNRNPHPHRIEFRKMIASIESDIVYSFADKPLHGDCVGYQNMVQVDPGVAHSVYNQCAVNVVTETVMDRPSLSEKSVKPMVARQIPVIVGPVGVNQFYQDLGFDMFEDIVPWQLWDQISDHTLRMQQIADFVIHWFESGRVLEHYRSMIDRVEFNKQYVHSDQFRSIILKQMPRFGWL